MPRIDWRDAYYEQQALHTEATGMLGQERDRWKARAEKAEGELKEARALLLECKRAFLGYPPEARHHSPLDLLREMNRVLA